MGVIVQPARRVSAGIVRLARHDELHALLTNPQLFPVELTLSSGGKVRIDHPEYVHVSRKLGKIFFYPRGTGGGRIEIIFPAQIVKIRGKVKRRAS